MRMRSYLGRKQMLDRTYSLRLRKKCTVDIWHSWSKYCKMVSWYLFLWHLVQFLKPSLRTSSLVKDSWNHLEADAYYQLRILGNLFSLMASVRLYNGWRTDMAQTSYCNHDLAQCTSWAPQDLSIQVPDMATRKQFTIFHLLCCLYE